MKTETVIQSIVRILFSFCLGLIAMGVQAAARPNIVLILADDLGMNDLGCYGRKDHRTPNLDRLSREGLRFTASYCAQPICSPSRAALLTGRHPARLHLTTYLPGRADSSAQAVLHPQMRQELPLLEKTLAEYLKEMGYATACIGKWHLGGAGFFPTNQGFDYYYPGRATTPPSETEGSKGEFELTTEAEKFMEKNRDTPFFLYLAHNSPHISFAATDSQKQRHEGAFNPTYAAVIESLDASVGRLLQKLSSLGLDRNTVVIFTSDNGGLHVPEGSHQRVTHNLPFRAGKGYLYEGGLRIPLLVRWAGRIKPATIQTPVVNTDLLPTLLELLGKKAANDLDGVSFGRLLRGRSFEHPDFYWHFPHYNNQGGRPSGAVRTGRWKMIEYYDEPRAELYDLSQDPGEKTDLAGRFPDRTKKLQKQLGQWLKKTEAQTNRPNPDFDPARFQRLYRDFDPSRYDPTEPASFEKVLEWRKEMNAAVARRR